MLILFYFFQLQVIPKKTVTLNPNAKVFQSPKLSNSVTTTPESTDSSNADWSGQSDHDSRNSAASSPQVAMTTQGTITLTKDK